MNKKMIYAAYGIEYKSGKILAPVFGWINSLLIDGNSKLGKGVWTFSTLPGTAEYIKEFFGEMLTAKGTCPCDCIGCYAKTGFFRMPSVEKSLFVKTYLARNYPDFVRRAIIAQIKADSISLCRIHASGDFFSREYVDMWKDIVNACNNCAFWSYTKNKEAENAFSDTDNCNIAKSIIPGFGFNFGKCAYILRVYKALKAMGKDVYICRCGIDKNQHCTNCKVCSKNEYVLFIEHSTAYKAEEDPLFPELKAIIENQPKV